MLYRCARRADYDACRVSHMSASQDRKALSVWRVTVLKIQVRGRRYPTKTTQLHGLKHEYWRASDLWYPNVVASAAGTLGRSEQYTSRKKSYARPALALFWPVCTAANRRKPRNLTLLRPACNRSTKRFWCVRPCCSE